MTVVNNIGIMDSVISDILNVMRMYMAPTVITKNALGLFVSTTQKPFKPLIVFYVIIKVFKYLYLYI